MTVCGFFWSISAFFISVWRASCCLQYLRWFMGKTVWSRNWNGLYFCLYLPEAEHTVCGGNLHQKEAYIHLKDSSTELRLVMQKRQQELMEKQDYEIHLATLQERNRIAREIHDNVGHMLSRAILQMGALQTIHQEEPLHGQLLQINDTLGEAMNSIRESVHDLHNESLDLRQALLDICREFEKIVPLIFIMI